MIHRIAFCILLALLPHYHAEVIDNVFDNLLGRSFKASSGQHTEFATLDKTAHGKPGHLALPDASRMIPASSSQTAMLRGVEAQATAGQNSLGSVGVWGAGAGDAGWTAPHHGPVARDLMRRTGVMPRAETETLYEPAVKTGEEYEREQVNGIGESPESEPK